jgi:hypothetical protein
MTAQPGDRADSCFPGSGNPHLFSEHFGEGLQIQDVFEVWLRLDQPAQPHRGRHRVLRHEDRGARTAREPAHRGIRFPSTSSDGKTRSEVYTDLIICVHAGGAGSIWFIWRKSCFVIWRCAKCSRA